MGNVIKSGTTIIQQVATRAVFRVGVDGSADYGPTDQTGFYNGITPPASGYTIYVAKETQGPSMHVANNDSQCIFFLKSFGATGTTISDVLAWANGQTNIWVSSVDLTSGDFDSGTPEIVTSGLVLHLDANNSSSYSGTGNTWTDIAGTAQNITFTGSPTFTSGSPSYFTFNGTSQYGIGSGAVVPTTGYTKSVWVYLNGYQDNNIVSGNGHFIYMGVGGTDKKIYCGHADWPSYIAYPSTNTVNLSTWYNITLTFNTTDGMKLYINGTLDSTYTARKTAHTGTGTINLATYAGGNLLKGRISKVYCYDRSLTSQEVSDNYDADASLFGL